MKMTLTIAVALACAVFNQTFAQPIVGVSDSSAGPESYGPLERGDVSAAAVDPANVFITVTPVLMATKSSPSGTAAANELIEDAVAGTLNTGSTLNTPDSYIQCYRRMKWQNTVYSTTVPMWDGVLNPPAPFDMDKGPILAQLIDVRSASGVDDVSLDMLSVASWSSDGNVLGDTLTFTANSYTLQAIVIKADGTRITSGSASQKGVRVIVITMMKLFNVGGTQSGIDSVRNWVTDHVSSAGDYKITYTAQLIGMPETASKAMVSVNPPQAVAPVLAINQSGHVWATNGEADRTYKVLTSPSVTGMPWTLSGTTSGTNGFHTMFPNTARFFRFELQ